MRQLRFTRQGAIYHITCRANHKERFLASPMAKALFVETLAKLQSRYECRIIDFVVMDNHIHLLFEPRGDSTLSVSMKWLFGVYSMNYNRVFKTWGSVWGGRFFSRPIGGMADLESTLAYIDANPTRAFLATRPEDWAWGGLWMHRQGPSTVLGAIPEWLVRDFGLGSDPTSLAGGSRLMR